VNDKRPAKALYEAGVDCVISDAPERVLAAYQESRAKPGNAKRR
jgi:glycerophosphoryl diester phosphodiesterase